VAFDSIHESKRHKSGLAMRFPRVSRIRRDKPAAEADTIDGLRRLVS
jgi:DNA ligase-1